MNCDQQAKILVETIQNDFRNGSMTIAKNAVEGLVSYLTMCSHIEEEKLLLLISELKNAKPSMVALRNTFETIEKNIQELGLKRIHDILENVLNLLKKSTKQVVENAIQYVQDNFSGQSLVIATTSYSSTCLQFIGGLSKKKDLIVQILASRWKEFDYSLALLEKCKELGVEAKVLEFEELQNETSKIDFAVVGADCVCQGKGIINGIPSEQLARLCFQYGIPFFVLAESVKFADFCHQADGFDFIPINYVSKIFSNFETDSCT